MFSNTFVLYVALVLIYGVVFLISLVSAPVKKRLPISEPLLALLVGALIGLKSFGPVHVRSDTGTQTFLKEFAEITLAIALMTTALQLPRGYLRRHWKVILIVLGLGMPLMWATSSAIVYFVLGYPIWISVLIAASVTPTDPVLASTIVTGQTAEENIAGRIRDLVIVESGFNDGLAWAFVLLPINFLIHPPHQAFVNWLVYSVFWEVGGAILFGAILGLVAGVLTSRAFGLEMVEHTSFLGITLALSLAVLGALDLIHTDGILGVFVAGVVYDNILGFRGHQLQRAEHVQQAVERFFELPVFVVLGAMLPWQQWEHLGWTAWAVAILILLFRRIPVILLLKPLLRPALFKWRDALFVGWFGPIGISALFYSTLIYETVQIRQVWPIISLIIVASIVAHGVSATPLTRLFGRRLEADAGRSENDPEARAEQRVHEIGQDIADHVHREVRETIERQTSNIVARHLTFYRQQSQTHGGSPRAQRTRRAIARRFDRPGQDDSAESIENLAREIAQAVAQRATDTLAQATSEQVIQNLDYEGRGRDLGTPGASNQRDGAHPG